jgi:hypothetical protein
MFLTQMSQYILHTRGVRIQTQGSAFRTALVCMEESSSIAFKGQILGDCTVTNRQMVVKPQAIKNMVLLY